MTVATSWPSGRDDADRRRFAVAKAQDHFVVKHLGQAAAVASWDDENFPQQSPGSQAGGGDAYGAPAARSRAERAADGSPRPPPLGGRGLVEGRYPRLIESGSVAKAAGKAGRHVRERGFEKRIAWT